ncbi:MAG: Cytochrome b6 [Rhodocyclaceae bacterium]|nr:MAG: hydrogenase iron-sulfur subunit [Rhodocyclaceae bacterium]MBE7421245.1 hydrogenase iron-sulfur subunit [Zoogloeaceae bacterium]MBV6407711.1 Cytochrome b6 [Rhodocyclaceae bacterium]CAG0932407.1 Cytochrome b6 [Rhodocyclaceae bacterium]
MRADNSLRQGGFVLWQRVEALFDAVFGAGSNPLRHLGALGFYFVWIALVTGIYLFIVLDTGIEDIHTSIEYYTHEQWWLGGILRSLHRYSADALVLVMLLHLVREFLYGRYHGFRWYSWVTGVPALWLVYASGIGGYWLVWDQLGLFSAIASAEWFDWLPIFSDPATRNFLPGVLNDRFFSLLVFLHIGIPLFLLLALWVHIQRVSQADVFPARALALGSLVMLLALSLIKPTVSHGKADLSVVPSVLHIDWYYLFMHPLMYLTSPAALWAMAGLFTLLLLALPLLPRPKPQPIAVVNPPNCNGCRRCFADCPYGAIAMLPHPDKPGHELARVLPELCASCGICAGACPSSTPFRSVDRLVTGIDMPQQPVGALREEMEHRIAALAGPVKIAVFGCDCAAEAKQLEDSATVVFSLMCTGLLPPSFVEYALRGGADGVLVTGCREGSCAFRFGTRWTEERLTRRREPHLRPTVPGERLRLAWADSHEMSHLKAALDDFREHLQSLGAGEKRLPPYTPRRIAHHG